MADPFGLYDGGTSSNLMEDLGNMGDSTGYSGMHMQSPAVRRMVMTQNDPMTGMLQQPPAAQQHGQPAHTGMAAYSNLGGPMRHSSEASKLQHYSEYGQYGVPPQQHNHMNETGMSVRPASAATMQSQGMTNHGLMNSMQQVGNASQTAVRQQYNTMQQPPMNPSHHHHMARCDMQPQAVYGMHGRMNSQPPRHAMNIQQQPPQPMQMNQGQMWNNHPTAQQNHYLQEQACMPPQYMDYAQQPNSTTNATSNNNSNMAMMGVQRLSHYSDQAGSPHLGGMVSQNMPHLPPRPTNAMSGSAQNTNLHQTYSQNTQQMPTSGYHANAPVMHANTQQSVRPYGYGCDTTHQMTSDQTMNSSGKLSHYMQYRATGPGQCQSYQMAQHSHNLNVGETTPPSNMPLYPNQQQPVPNGSPHYRPIYPKMGMSPQRPTPPPTITSPMPPTSSHTPDRLPVQNSSPQPSQGSYRSPGTSLSPTVGGQSSLQQLEQMVLPHVNNRTSPNSSAQSNPFHTVMASNTTPSPNVAPTNNVMSPAAADVPQQSHFVQSNSNSSADSARSLQPQGNLGPMPSPVMSAPSPNTIAMSGAPTVTPLNQTHNTITATQDSYEIQQMQKIQQQLQQLFAMPQTAQTRQKILELQEQLCILQQPLPPGPQQPLPVPIPFSHSPLTATQSPQPPAPQMQSPCLQPLPAIPPTDITTQGNAPAPPTSYMLLPTQPQLNTEPEPPSMLIAPPIDSPQTVLLESSLPSHAQLHPVTSISPVPMPASSPFDQTVGNNTNLAVNNVPLLCNTLADGDFDVDGQKSNHLLMDTTSSVQDINAIDPTSIQVATPPPSQPLPPPPAPLPMLPQTSDFEGMSKDETIEDPMTDKKKKKTYKKRDPKEPKPKKPKTPKEPKAPKSPKSVKDSKETKRPKRPKKIKDSDEGKIEGDEEVKEEPLDSEKTKSAKKGKERSKSSRATPKKKPLPNTDVFSKKKRKRTGSSDVSDLEETSLRSPAPEDDSIQKRRSARNTKRKKYTDDIDIELSEEDQLDLDGDKLNQSGQKEESTLKPGQFFINPNDEDSMVVEKLMNTRTITKENESGEPIEIEEFYVKYKNFSYLHCDWKTQEELEKGDKRVIMKIKRYKQKKQLSENIFEFLEEEPFNPDYVEVDRVLDMSETKDELANEVIKHYLVKWQQLSYEESTWELEEDVEKVKVEQFLRYRDPPTNNTVPSKRPKASEWNKLEASANYKNGNTLREYQLEGLNWLMFSWHNEQNCILADEMGLGKTIQSISFLCELFKYGYQGPFLVIAPLSTIANWQREFETWSDLNVIVYHGSCASRSMIQDYEMYYKDDKGKRIPDVYKFHVLITTFEIIITDCLELRAIPWRCCIIDEAHRLKNKNCKLLEGLRLIQMEHRVLLSGTPLQNNVEELFSLLNFLEPAQFTSSEEFLKEFGDLKSETQVHKLQQLLKPMMLRRLKEDVEKSLAPKEETIIEVELTNIQKKYYRAILERNFSFLAKGGTSANVPNLMNTMMELRKCCIHPYLISGAEEQIQLEYKQNKFELFDAALQAMIHSSGKLVLMDKLLPKLKVNGHRVLVFSQMVRCLDILEDYLIQRRYPYERIDGRVRGNLRQAAIDRFCKPDSDRFVFLLCTRAGGLGINLTAADTVIIFDSDWNPQNDLQAQARCHRIGQQKAVKVYRLICRNTYEREMFDKASLKLGLDKAVLQSMNTTGKDGLGPAQQLSKKEIEDLLRKGAYGAVMEDDNAGDQFCEEDIDQILQGRTQVIQLESGVKGSTFAKASFVSSGNRTDIDIDDPEFWQKWAKKADIDLDEMNAKNDLIVHEPRRRVQTRRFGNEDGVLELSEIESSDDDDSITSSRTGRNLKKSRRSRRRRDDRDDDMDCYGSMGMWTRSECFKVEKGLLTFGWGRWTEIFTHGKFKRKLTESDVEEISRAVLMYCLKYYKGDDKIKGFIWDLISPTTDGQIKVHKNHSGLSAPVPRGRKSKKTKKETKQSMNVFMDLYNWAKDPKYNPEFVLADEGYKRHLQRHANKVLLRVRLLYYVKQEVIGEMTFQVSRGVSASDIPILSPCADGDIPVFWWDKEADKSLLVGVYKHGYERYNVMRLDPTLCFLVRCGPPDGAAVLAELNEQVTEDDLKADKDDIDEDDPLSPGSPSGDSTPKPPTIPVPAEACEMGKLPFPTATDLNCRLRRIITGYQRNHKKQEMKLVQRAKRIEKREKFEAAIREREVKKRELQQSWSRREELEFYRTVSTFGVEYIRKQKCYEWSRFRALSRLEKKYDDTLTEYYKAFYAMCKKACGKPLAKDEELLPYFVEPISEERARRCLEKIDLLNTIREETLRHPALEDRLKQCPNAMDLPDWWIPGKHDKELLIGAAKHGLNRMDYFILHDPDLSFLDVLKQYTKAKGISEDSEQMKLLLNIHEKCDSEDESNDVLDLQQTSEVPVKVKEEKMEIEVKVEIEEKLTKKSVIKKEKLDVKNEKLDVKNEKLDVENEKSDVKIEKSVCENEKSIEETEKSLEKSDKIVEDEDTEKEIIPKEEIEKETDVISDTKKESTTEQHEVVEQESMEIEKVEPKEENSEDEKMEVDEPAVEKKESMEIDEKLETKEEKTDQTEDEPTADDQLTDIKKEEKHSENTVDSKESTKIENTELKSPDNKQEIVPKCEDVKEETAMVDQNEIESTDPEQGYHNPVSWPKDRVLQYRLEGICHWVEKNEWPLGRAYRAGSQSMSPTLTEPDSTPHVTPDQTPRKDDLTRDSSSPLMDHISNLESKSSLLDPGDILYPRRRRRRRKIEIEAERASFLTAKLRALLHQSLHHTAMDLKSHGSKHDLRSRSLVQSGLSAVPPPAHQHAPSSHLSYVVGSLDLSLKVPKGDLSDASSPMDLSSHLKSSKSSSSHEHHPKLRNSGVANNMGNSNASDSLVMDLQMRKRRRQEMEELEKLKQMKPKDDSNRRKQRKKLDDIVGTLSAQIVGGPQNLAKTATSLSDSKLSMPKFSESSLMKRVASSSESFLNKDLAKWLSNHPGITIEKPNIVRPDHRMMDSESTEKHMNPSSAQSGLEILKLARKKRRPRIDPSKLEFEKLTGNENVAVVNRLTGKKITGNKAPPLKHLATWLKQNPMFDVDPKWSHLVKEKANLPSDVKKRSSSHSSHSDKRKYNTSLLSTAAATSVSNSLSTSFPSLTGLSSLSGLSSAGLFPGYAGLKLPSLSEHGKSNASPMFLPFGGLSNLGLSNPLFANIANFGFPGLPVTSALSSSSESKSDRDKKGKYSSTVASTTSVSSALSTSTNTSSSSLPFLFPAPGLLYNPLGLGNFTLPTNLPTSFASLAQTSLLNGLGGNQSVLANGLMNQEIESDDDSLKSLMGNHDDDEDLPDDDTDNNKEVMQKEVKETSKTSTNCEKNKKLLTDASHNARSSEEKSNRDETSVEKTKSTTFQ
uniref:DNA helicase n=1 Tax=Strigamia maritima TaxID=126957 RepID=T1J482_STRMM